LFRVVIRKGKSIQIWILYEYFHPQKHVLIIKAILTSVLWTFKSFLECKCVFRKLISHCVMWLRYVQSWSLEAQEKKLLQTRKFLTWVAASDPVKIQLEGRMYWIKYQEILDTPTKWKKQKIREYGFVRC